MFQGREVSTEDNPQFGCSATAIDNVSIAIVTPVLDKGRVRNIEVETGIAQTTVHCILTEHLCKNKVAAWWVAHALTDTQKQTHLEIVQEHLKQFRREGENF